MRSLTGRPGQSDLSLRVTVGGVDRNFASQLGGGQPVVVTEWDSFDDEFAEMCGVLVAVGRDAMTETFGQIPERVRAA
nr:hypothetical protein [Deinococcus marmoris]